MAVLVGIQRKSWSFFPEPCGHVSDTGAQTAFLFGVTRGNAGKKRKVCLDIPPSPHVFHHDFLLLFPYFSVPVCKF